MSDAERARRYLLEGDPAMALGVCEGALGDSPPDAAVGLRALAARAARELGDLASGVSHLEAGEALARKHGLDVLGSLLVQLGELHLRRGAPGHGAVAFEEALGELGSDDPLRARAQAGLDEARAREADEPEPEDAAEPPVSEEDAPAAAQRLLDMAQRLLEADPNMELPALLDLILAELVQASGADRGFVLLREPGEGLVIRAARDKEGGTIVDPARQISRRIAERAASEARPLRAVRPAEDPRFAGSRSAKALDLQAVVAAPLRYRRIDLGSVVLDRSGGKVPPFDDAAEALVARFAKLASGVIVRTRKRDAERRRTQALEDLFARGAEQVRERFASDGFVGQSEAAYQLLRLLERAAPTDARVLIRGESGTGKELVARMLHTNSARKAAPFHAVNCAALAENLLEDELFGHAKGAFTGAEADREGLFERANGGTVFLDEIGDASPRLQAELLRVLQEGEVRRLGDQEVRSVDVRVLAATHQDLESMVAEGRFREDLLYRLNVLEVRVPSLRERREDIPALARQFAKDARALLSDPEAAHALDDETLAKLQAQPWPGNIRELKNAVQRLVTVGELSAAADPGGPGAATVRAPLDAEENELPTLREAERRLIVKALSKTRGAKAETAKLLGISRRTLYNKIRAYGLE